MLSVLICLRYSLAHAELCKDAAKRLVAQQAQQGGGGGAAGGPEGRAKEKLTDPPACSKWCCNDRTLPGQQSRLPGCPPHWSGCAGKGGAGPAWRCRTMPKEAPATVRAQNAGRCCIYKYLFSPPSAADATSYSEGERISR